MKPTITLACIALLISAGCGIAENEANKRGRGDAPVDRETIDDSPARVVNFPDQFSNVTFKCLGVNGIYQTTQNSNGKEMTIVPNDPECPAS